ncbi:potassium channel family protein [uncultured Arthrobacter sp.]|uniref:potassium channel family protein n=1 Tax=uncultured Arthrobacter sp. TaxID=114050 RepID=UPI0026168191|nr:potassium channel family protein [uncultured Arthrobacter sp.]
MDVLLTLVGLVLVVLGLRDMYHSLIHPSGKGALSHGLMYGLWRISYATGHRLGPVGPGAMAAAVALWVTLQVMGWALVYLPHVPGGFVYSSGLDPARYDNLAEAVYISLVALATLGLGDVVASDPWMRLVMPVEALTGFALLTAALTWFTQVYSPLSRRRALALRLHGLARADYAAHLPQLDPAAAGRTLESVAADVGQMRIDLTQHTETYYFREGDPELALACQLPYALTLRDSAAASDQPQLRAGARVLAAALDQLAAKLDHDFLHTDGTPEEVTAAYARDHAGAGRRSG